MRSLLDDRIAACRDREAQKQLYPDDPDEVGGMFHFPSPTHTGQTLTCVASNTGGWDHVSVSASVPRTPTWAEMEHVRRIFWRPDDCVMQLHPPLADYINGSYPGQRALFTLHLWCPTNGKIPRPPRWMVGANSQEEAEQAHRDAELARRKSKPAKPNKKRTVKRFTR